MENYILEKDINKFKTLVKARKKELEYYVTKDIHKKEVCENCSYFEGFTPYMNRCSLISFDINYKIASIRLRGDL